MSIIEQIKAEIERLNPETTISEFEDGFNSAINRVLEILDTIEESGEPINSEDAEKAADEYARCHYISSYSQELARNDFLAGYAYRDAQITKGDQK